MTQTPATPQAGITGDPQPQAGDPTTIPTPQAGSGKTADDYERMITQLRAENAGHRVKLKKFEEDEQARAQAQMTEAEKLKADLAARQEQLESTAAELYQARVYQEVGRVASKFNFLVSADTLAKMLLIDDDAIKFEDGKPTNIEQLLEKLAKAEPDLVRQEQQQRAPQLPGMNPGRSTITQPGQTPGKVPNLFDPGIWKR
jgi:hypothetical protein